MIESPLASVKKSGGGVLVAVNIPPSSASNVYSSYRDAAEVLSSIDHNTLAVMAGDFNPVISIPSIDWDNIAGPTLSLVSQILIDMTYSLQLEQQNKIENARGVLLDLIFSSVKLSVRESEKYFIKPEEAHLALNLKL